MMRSMLGLTLVLSLVVLGCEDKPASTAPAASAAPATSASPTGATKPASTAATPAPTPEAKPAEPASAAASFPATALPAKDFADFTIGLPTGGKLDKTGDDKASLETPDYKLMLKKADAKDSISEMKTMIQKMPGFKAITIDQPDGLVVEVDEKGAPQFLITRHVKVGDMTLSCENALTKPPKDKAKAQEAFDVCGTIKKK
jgi:hypothetical protein